MKRTKINALELLALNSDKKYYNYLYERKYKEVKESWLNTIDRWNKEIAISRDSYFDEIHGFVYSRNGKILLPKK